MEIGPAVLIDGDMLDITKSNTGFSKTIGNRVRGKAGPMLHPTKSFLFRCRHKLAVAYQCCRGIAMECIKTKDNHSGIATVTDNGNDGRALNQEAVICVQQQSSTSQITVGRGRHEGNGRY